MSRRVPCPRCFVVPPFDVNNAVSLTAHYEAKHPDVDPFAKAAEIVLAVTL